MIHKKVMVIVPLFVLIFCLLLFLSSCVDDGNNSKEETFEAMEITNHESPGKQGQSFQVDEEKIPQNTLERSNQLKAFPIVLDKNNGGWEWSDTGAFKSTIDTNMSYENLPAVQLENSKKSVAWIYNVPLRNWCTSDLSPYFTNGVLKFNIKGSNGGEDFLIGFVDHLPERRPNTDIYEKVPMGNYIKVGTEWESVSIPLTDIISNESEFSLKDIQLLRLSNVNNNPMKVWLNHIRITSPDMEKIYPAIKLNQVGYTVNAEKYALVSGFDGVLKADESTKFQVKRREDSKVVLTGKLQLVTDLDSVISGERVFAADFSALKTRGAYYISIDANGIEDSVAFQIGNDIYKPLITDAVRYFYYQRANTALDEKHAGEYSHEAWHVQDFNCPLESDSSIKMDVSQGWYDAGDYGKTTNVGAVSLSDLLWAYEMFPEQFQDGQNNVPESGNGIPDILDEARYELDFILKMQNKQTGGFYSHIWKWDGLEVERFITDVNSSNKNIQSTSYTADCTAILAHASQVFKAFDKAYADKMLAAAEKGWEYLELNPQYIPSSTNDTYYDPEDASDRLWAAGALYRTVGSVKYNEYFIENYTKFRNFFYASSNVNHSQAQMTLPAFFSYLSASKVNDEVKDWFAESFKVLRARMLEEYRSNPWRIVLPPTGSYFWGSNMVILNTTEDVYIGSRLLGDCDKAIVDMANAGLNYILGINPLRFSFVSGYGEDCVMNIFSSIYNSDGKSGIPKGYMAGGANSAQGRALSQFDGKCYIDSSWDWVTNEHCIEWNSALVFAAALAAHEGIE